MMITSTITNNADKKREREREEPNTLLGRGTKEWVKTPKVKLTEQCKLKMCLNGKRERREKVSF